MEEEYVREVEEGLEAFNHAVPEIHEDTEESIDEARHHEVSFITCTCTCTPVYIHVHVPL